MGDVGLKTETVTVIFTEVARDNWAVGGTLFADRPAPAR
jgi:phenylpyruvate tautomerase PptA (4-oxalocrotonate tautomerase family)